MVRDGSRSAKNGGVTDIKIDYDKLLGVVQNVLEEGSFSARKLSMHATQNKNPDLIRNMLAGTKPSLKSVVGIARALDLPSFMFFKNLALPGMTPKAWLPVRGSVEAGIWREQIETSPEDWFDVEVDAPYAELGPHEHGLVVKGRSMDKIFPPGTVLRCIDMITANPEWGDGDYVIVERHRGDFVELTCKRLSQRMDGNWELRAESHLEEFRDPIFIGAPTADAEVFDHGQGEVRVRALVVDAFLPLARRKVRAHAA